MKAVKPLRRCFLLLTILMCMLFVLHNPTCGADRKAIPTRNVGQESAGTDLDSASHSLPDPRLSSSFTLSRFDSASPYAFKLRACGTTVPKAELKAQALLPTPSKPSLERTLFTSSLATLAALSITDIITTVKALKLDGLREGNPVMQPIVKNVYLFTAVKLSVAVLDSILLKKLHGKNKKWGWIASVAANLVMSYVVANNIRKIQEIGER
jgi:hypothetical protein